MRMASMTEKNVPPGRPRRLLRVFLIAATVFALAWIIAVTAEVISGRTKLKQHPVPAQQTPGPEGQPPLQPRA
ncbi:hypothetical protein [Sphingomonas abaci]|uniref:Uncharacterized protein n=1 Tax=Sphingomonas abaci TaxID=237611 RepID=A0A7W7AHJ1_9SPHN|nr:hypothetical protein [Sphingomonas abaci]MBB4617121.1 hypothetical protein [Sphingomonas abaci]